MPQLNQSPVKEESPCPSIPIGSTEEATPTYLRGGDPALADYYPAWLDNLADDVTLEGSMMDGAVQGPDAVRAVLIAIRSLYDEQEFHFAGAYGENGFLEDYTARVAGEAIGNYTVITRNTVGQTQHIVGNSGPGARSCSCPA